MESYQSAKEEIKKAADIIELIGQHIQLKRAGQNHIGLCPFHSEKDPSFTVSPARQMFHCFGCKKGGDIFAFWMEYHKVPFSQALQDLADRYQIPLPNKRLTRSEKGKMELKESLFKINEIVAGYFHDILIRSEKGAQGRDYLTQRFISKEIISEFILGYAPDEWDGLTKYLKRKRIDMDKAVQAGLIIPKKHGGYYDRFRGRILFPILNMRQQIAGFGGRVLNDSLPKYLNTPETPIFHKGELLYGLYTSHEPIRESGRSVIVEGYTDVLALKRHGFHEAVATLGTTLTRVHIRKLKGYTKEAVVVFDSDAAGRSAAIQSLSLFLNEGLSSKVVVLPEREDPDSFINKNGLDGFLDLLNEAVPMFDFYLDQKLAHVTNGIEGQIDILKEILPVLSELNNVAHRSFYIRRLSEKMGIPESALLTELRKWEAHHSLVGDDRSLRDELSSSKAKNMDEQHLLNLIIHYPHTMEALMNHGCKVLLSDSVIMGIFDSMCDIYNKEGETKPSDILAGLQEDSARERFREVMMSPPIYPREKVDQAVKEFEEKIQKLKLAESIKRAKEKGDIDALNQILISQSNMRR
ncbi:MAG: DNA primase [Thermodesulfobacteriota bacterium]|nr:DNA primase [Thermodesulfobacteriota bacterium]